MKPGPKPKPAIVRFLPKVDRSGGPAACWPWRGSRDRHGYGSFNAGPERRTVRAYVIAWELAEGRRVRSGYEVHHTCVNPPCCNPAHLVEVTHRENILASVTNPWARAAAATACPQGHRYDEANTIVRRHGSRRCRECVRQQNAAYYAGLSVQARERRRVAALRENLTPEQVERRRAQARERVRRAYWRQRQAG